MLSIPRDTYAEVPARGGKDKINSAYAAGGPEAALEAVSLLLSREIKYYLATDLQGFVKIVDTLGGVTVEVDEAASEGLGIPPGTHRLQGEEALRFVRYRGYPMADIERINHQQVFLRALVDESSAVAPYRKNTCTAQGDPGYCGYQFKHCSTDGFRYGF